MKIAEDLGQILVVLHTLLVIIEMSPRLNKQSGSDRTGRIYTILKPALEYLYSFVIDLWVCHDL